MADVLGERHRPSLWLGHMIPAALTLRLHPNGMDWSRWAEPSTRSRDQLPSFLMCPYRRLCPLSTSKISLPLLPKRKDEKRRLLFYLVENEHVHSQSTITDEELNAMDKSLLETIIFPLE